MERYFSVMKEESGKDVERVASLREYIDLVIKNKEESADASQRVFGCFILEVLFFQLVLEVAPDLSGVPGADIHDFQEAASELGTYYLEGEAKRGNPGDVGYLGVGA